VLQPVAALLKQGTTPEDLALSCALGVTLGVTPVIGSTSLLCTAAALLFRLNLPAIQVVNYLVYPLQFALLIPFLRIGEWLLAAEPAPLSVTRIVEMIHDDVWQAIASLWTATLHALAAWVLLGTIIATILYFGLSAVFRKLQERRI
jgi:uncharacterized protein (DUF2062 family)